MMYTAKTREVYVMRGYFTASGYYGKVGERYMLFAGEAEYYEFMEDDAD